MIFEIRTSCIDRNTSERVRLGIAEWPPENTFVRLRTKAISNMAFSSRRECPTTGTVLGLARSMNNDCPYCNLAQKTGELFCSRHGRDMNILNSGIFLLHEKTLEECDPHITRLSLNFNLDGTQKYSVGSRQFAVDPENVLVLNEGTSFRTSLKSDSPNRMLTIAFRVGLAGKIYSSMMQTNESILSDRDLPTTDFTFFERTFTFDNALKHYINHLLTEQLSSQQDIDDQLETILEHVIRFHLSEVAEFTGVRNTRSSTRREIFRRLSWARDYIHCNYSENITVRDIASQACLSEFHFKRLFREKFGEAPYQYLKRIRLKKSETILKTGVPVKEACRIVGWQDASSFIRLFKQTTGVTPARFRELARVA